MPTPVNIRFELVWKPPKGRDIKLFIIGSIPELGTVDLTTRDFWTKFEKRLLRSFNEFSDLVKKKREGFERRRIRRATRQSARAGGNDDDLDSSDDSVGKVSRSSSGDSLASAIVEEIGRSEDPKALLHVFLDQSFEILTHDPDDEGVENYWQSESITISSCAYPDKFSFAFVAWNCDDNKLWAWEALPEARTVKLPDLRYTPKAHASVWSYRAKKWEVKDDERLQVKRLIADDDYSDDSGDEDDGEDDANEW